MRNIKVGDKVRISKTSGWYGYSTNGNPKDTVGVVTRITSSGELNYKVDWPNGNNSYDMCDLVLANRHKHADVIIEWANGAVIEAKPASGCKDWEVVSEPLWMKEQFYRVKPEKTPAELEREAISKEMAKLKERLDKLPV